MRWKEREEKRREERSRNLRLPRTLHRVQLHHAILPNADHSSQSSCPRAGEDDIGVYGEDRDLQLSRSKRARERQSTTEQASLDPVEFEEASLLPTIGITLWAGTIGEVTPRSVGLLRIRRGGSEN